MSNEELKNRFKTGDKPTGADYAALIDEIFAGTGVSQDELNQAKEVLQNAIDTTKADLEKELKTANDAIEDLKIRVATLENPA